MVDGFLEAMRSKGFSYNTTKSLRKFRCPTCDFEFSMMYARTIACQGCSEAVKDCPKVRCAKCDTEFFIGETPEIHNEWQERSISEHISNVVTKYQQDMGWRAKR